MKGVYILGFVMVLTILAGGEFVSSQVLGVSPGNIEFREVLRGGYAERQILITTSSDSEVEASIEMMGDAGEWLNVSESSFDVTRSSPGRILVTVQPPEDVPNGNYTGFLRVRMIPETSGSPDGRATITPQTVVDIVVNVEITDIEVRGCHAENFAIASVEKGDDLSLEFDFTNTGNVRMRPNANVEIWDQEQVTLVKGLELSGENVLPTRTERVSLKISTDDLEVEQYWAEVTAIDCFASDLLTFDVYEPGTLRANGVLTGIASTVWTEVGETVPITASFRNTGEKLVSAQFRGQITLDGRIVQLLESEASDVPVNEARDFDFFFAPEREGRYIVSGRVFYDRKRTFESSTVINVIAGSGFGKVISYLAYAVIISLAVLLVYKIKKEKKGGKHKW